MTTNTNDIDQIRELLFGDSAKQYDKKIQYLEQNLQEVGRKIAEAEKTLLELQSRNAELVKQIEKKTNDVSSNFSKELTAIRNTIDQRLTEVEQSKISRKLIGEYFSELSARLLENKSG